MVWKEDTEAFFDNEKKKHEYLKDVYKKHEDVLLAQMQDKEDHKNRKKMNTLELLYNKALMKAAADQADNVKKAKVWFDGFIELDDLICDSELCESLFVFLGSRKLQVGSRGAVPTCVPRSSFQWC